MPETVKFFTYDLLRSLNEKAVKERRNRSLYFEKLPIDPNNVYPVIMNFLHNDVEVRTGFIMNHDKEMAWIDLTLKEFNALPEVPRSELPDRESAEDDNLNN